MHLGGFWWSPGSRGEAREQRVETLESLLRAGASLGAGNESPVAPGPVGRTPLK